MIQTYFPRPDAFLISKYHIFCLGTMRSRSSILSSGLIRMNSAILAKDYHLAMPAQFLYLATVFESN